MKTHGQTTDYFDAERYIAREALSVRISYSTLRITGLKDYGDETRHPLSRAFCLGKLVGFLDFYLQARCALPLFFRGAEVAELADAFTRGVEEAIDEEEDYLLSLGCSTPGKR
jgi:hypothetical protein